MTSYDVEVRRHLYAMTLADGTPPSITALSAVLRASENNVRHALARLAVQRIVVIQPESGELLMVPPFSAVPTPFLVRTARYDCYANCAWDALGVAVMLRQEVHISTACACCGEGMAVRTRADAAPAGGGLIHFAVAARHWWDDIVYT